MSYLANNAQGLKADLSLPDGQFEVKHKTRAYAEAATPGLTLASGSVFPAGWSAEMVCTRRVGELGPGGLVVYDGVPGAVGSAIFSVDKDGNASTGFAPIVKTTILQPCVAGQFDYVIVDFAADSIPAGSYMVTIDNGSTAGGKDYNSNSAGSFSVYWDGTYLYRPRVDGSGTNDALVYPALPVSSGLGNVGLWSVVAQGTTDLSVHTQWTGVPGGGNYTTATLRKLVD